MSFSFQNKSAVTEPKDFERRSTSTLEVKGRIKYTHLACQVVLRPVETPWVSVLVAKLTALIHGDFYCQQQELKQKRLPWQEAAFNMVNNFGRLSPTGRRFGSNNLRDGLPYPYTEHDAEDYIHMMLSANKDNTFAFAIILDDKVIGSIGVFRQDNIHCKTAEMGYYIGEPYWGNGYMTNAIKQVCEYVFENTDIIRIFAEPFAHNIASCRALEKAGFQYEGTLKSNAVKCGSIIDMKMNALVRE